MVHVLIYVLEHMLVWGVLMVAWGIVAGFLFDAYEAIQERRRRQHRRARAEYERCAAEQSIRNTRRQAIRDLLVTECHYRDTGGHEVIESSAIEVRNDRA